MLGSRETSVNCNYSAPNTTTMCVRWFIDDPKLAAAVVLVKSTAESVSVYISSCLKVLYTCMYNGL